MAKTKKRFDTAAVFIRPWRIFDNGAAGGRNARDKFRPTLIVQKGQAHRYLWKANIFITVKPNRAY
ncbi:MAG TPA: hypothetical protein DC026_01285 [Erythrobacter sp.]|nr:hypothetical protein [Erythrobacter sp.]